MSEAARVPTSKDVARLAGVSQSTVSYVMTGKRAISEKTRRLVLDAMDQLLYEPNAGARALRSQRTSVIALIVPFDSEMSASELMTFIKEIAYISRQNDYDVLLVTSDEGAEGFRRVFARAQCDAAIVLEVAKSDKRVELARQAPVPTIFIGFPDDSDDLHCIDMDFETGAETLVNELCDVGSTEIVALGWDPVLAARDVNYIPRFRGAAESAAARRGVPLRWLSVPREEGGVEEFLDEVLRDGRRPGLLVASQVAKLGIALFRRGIRAGTDIDVVALSNHADAETQPIPLTAVSTHPGDVSRQAMDWLFALLRSPEATAPGRRVVASELVRRESTRHIPRDN
ncbi:LacI family DNA-binding transcriptional regulator [Microbacterium sp. PRC9]|uniref:LacI family DNA-binding transcriptional regulator n=1 Tax=Microbacterium sp. PRC9 TaxID=2962591 RepID=UPI002881D2F2|nr:LacI family DNA-binding transcriptional regulator [Microbacterium sp. PRC9]MDT0144825.1 LacI family DNA-binding transcriptional regulator [Microbacterium sp. PRC9]